MSNANDILAAYRDLIVYRLAQVSLVLFLPFALGNFVHGQTILGCTTFAVVVILALNAAAIRLRRPPLLSPAWLYVPVLGSLLVAISTQGLTGLFWLYPALIFFFFVLDRRQALQVDLGLILVLTPWAALHLGWELCSRVLATTVLTVLLTTTFLSIIAMLQEQTLVDPLTGAYNRRHLEVCLRSAIERLRRYGTPCSLLALDVDHFKRINDQYGHDAGDRVLRAVVELLGRRLRQLDLVFRTGGEEFVVLLGDTELCDALLVAEDLRRTLASSSVLAEVRVTVSVGVASLDPCEESDSWLRRGDVGLCEAKRSGRNRVVASPLARPTLLGG
ncbi:MAG: hypothetical protein AMXMBFR33_44070 [Candidatus Xenobia bacterium]